MSNLLGWLRCIGDVQANLTATLNQILERISNMPTLEDFHAAQVTLDTKLDTLITAFHDAKANVASLTAAVAAAQGDPVAIQAAIDDATAQSAKIDAALGAVIPTATK